MSYKVLSLADKEEWNKYLELLPIDQQDVYYTPEYYELYEKNGDGKGQCFVFEKEGEIALYPFLINSVNELGYDLDQDYYDIQGAYGYNGVVSSSYDEQFIKEFYNAFDNYFLNKNIIAEFTRFNPILENHIFESRFTPLYVLDNVLIDTSLDVDIIWRESFDNGVRKAVRKGIRNELMYESYRGDELGDDLLNYFLKIYYSTMDRNEAGDFYYFSEEYFSQMRLLLPQRILFSFVKKDDKVISTELNLINKSNSYGFLGGTIAEYYSISPNSFLRFELIKDLKNRGIKTYSIGGGMAKDDSVYKFKKSFSKNIDSKFFIGKKIHNEVIYNKVINQWKTIYNKKDDHKLLKYRNVESNSNEK